MQKNISPKILSFLLALGIVTIYFLTPSPVTAELTEINTAEGFPKSWSDAIFSQDTQPNELKVATYNLLNLFDHVYDEGKDDYTFLPKSEKGPGSDALNYCSKMKEGHFKTLCTDVDWTEERWKQRLVLFKKLFDSQGSLPDILGVQEIENEFMTEQLGEALGYGQHCALETNRSCIATNSPHKRGLDVALFFNKERLTLIEHEEIDLHTSEFPQSFKEDPTRNIIRAHFNVKGAPKDLVLAVFVNHWPSQAAPAEKRMTIARHLKKVVEKQRAIHGKDNYYVLSIGDFNVLPVEYPHAITNVLCDLEHSKEDALVDLKWYVDHILGDRNLAKNNSYPFPVLTKFNPARGRMAPGTHWYIADNHYSPLDHILLSQNFFDLNGLLIMPETFRIISPKMALRTNLFNDPKYDRKFTYGMTSERVPNGYDFLNPDKPRQGFSDHLPMVTKIQIRSSNSARNGQGR